MDDTATSLLSELLDKLAELDQKVCNYRQDMAHDFQRYAHRLLYDAPDHVSVRVEQVLADELHNYPALSPGFALDTASADLGRSAVGRWARRGRVSPPPVLPHTSGVPPNDGSPLDRNREREFHGLFTPSFLPLLEVMQPKQSAPAPVAISLPAPTRDIDLNNTREPSAHAQLDKPRPGPDSAHHCTEELLSSINSDDCGLRARKSALRRSSSGSTKEIQSPRRVRFDVEGEEVLPTVSPILPPALDLATSPPDTYRVIPFHDSPSEIVLEEEDSILGNSPPRPKKISSTDRLKALARSSTEDTSKWTVVGETYEDDDEEEGLVMFGSRKKPKSAVVEQAPNTTSTNGTSFHQTQDEPSKEVTNESHGDRVIGESGNDILQSTYLASVENNKRSSPPPETRPGVQQVLPDTSKPSLATLDPPSQTIRNLREEDMFMFDDDDDDKPQPTKSASKYIEEEESEAEEQTDSPGGNSAERAHVALYSTSPAISIAKPASLPSTSAASSAAGRAVASVGSYKGAPFIMGVVRNEEIHKKAMEMGDFHSFVGSVDGRSGMDPSDQFAGTPRSLGERLMEEAHARRLKHKGRRQE